MKSIAITGRILALALLLPLAACGRSSDNGSSDNVAQAMKDVDKQTSSSVIGAEVQKSIDKAKQELLTQNIDVNSVHIGHASSKAPHDLPKAVITPQGELQIAGKTMPATPDQHTMLQDYRTRIIDIADAGMDIGARGADLGMSAAKQAIWGALTGKSDKQIDAAIQPQADKIKDAAMQLCKRMPALLASQQKLAAAMPAFRPYATMTQKDVDDCDKDVTDANGKKGVVVFSE